MEFQLLKELSKPLVPASLTLLVRLSSVKGDASKCNLPKIFELMTRALLVGSVTTGNAVGKCPKSPQVGNSLPHHLVL